MALARCPFEANRIENGDASTVVSDQSGGLKQTGRHLRHDPRAVIGGKRIEDSISTSIHDVLIGQAAVQTARALERCG